MPWFTDPIASGEVLLTWREGSWYVDSPDLDSEVKCLLQGDAEIDPDDSPERLSGTALKYMRGSGERPDFLHLCPEETTPTTEDDTEASGTERQPSRTESHASTPRWNLADFTGSGDVVTVEAVVDSIRWVKKQTAGVPDIKGRLADDSVPEGVPFVVNDGVNHPYLEEGTRFEFTGVKDHYYSAKSEVQVMVTEHTDVTDKVRMGQSSPTSSTSSADSSSGQSFSRRNRSASERKLKGIVEEHIGDEEFTMAQEDRESVVGRAKRRARKQQRDPAIDPKLRGDEGDDE
jgi:hypothetical protein